jgi:SsrA-binding protein
VSKKLIQENKMSKKIIATNKKAYHEYFIEEEFEAGIELFGVEVKSLRQGKVNLKDSWCSIVKGEIFVNNMHISHYEQASIFNKDPLRVRRLLMHKREIDRLLGTTKQTGYAIIPISIYFNQQNRVKLKIGLCKGKKLYDKRNVAAEKDAKRHVERELKERYRG